MKDRQMEALQALVLSDVQLREMLTDAAREGATKAIEELRADLRRSPDDTVLEELRTYIANPASIANPAERWAHSGIIRQLQPTARGKAKSTAWFMKFQRDSGLSQCRFRQSPAYGRRREWTFYDIRLAWCSYYRPH